MTHATGFEHVCVALKSPVLHCLLIACGKLAGGQEWGRVRLIPAGLLRGGGGSITPVQPLSYNSNAPPLPFICQFLMGMHTQHFPHFGLARFNAIQDRIRGGKKTGAPICQGRLHCLLQRSENRSHPMSPRLQGTRFLPKPLRPPPSYCFSTRSSACRTAG